MKDDSNRKSSDSDEKIRFILAMSTVGLMFTTLLAYVITRDVLVLGTATIVDVAVVYVFRYFFTKS